MTDKPKFLFEYTVVYSKGATSARSDLKDRVEELLNDGWELAGGVAMNETDKLFSICQALTKKVELHYD